MNETQLEITNTLIDHSIETICVDGGGNPRPEAKETLELLRDYSDLSKSEKERDAAFDEIVEKRVYGAAINNDVDRLILDNNVFYEEAKLGAIGEFGDTEKKEVREIVILRLDEKVKELEPKKLSKDPSKIPKSTTGVPVGENSKSCCPLM